MLLLGIWCRYITFGEKNYESCLYCNINAIVASSSMLCAYKIMFTIWVITDTMLNLCVE